VDEVNPLKTVLNEPIPEPSSVLWFPILGLGVVEKQTPLRTMELPPSLEISPPITTVSTPTEEGDEVVIVGKQIEC
jgi:hypothetical protein